MKLEDTKNYTYFRRAYSNVDRWFIWSIKGVLKEIVLKIAKETSDIKDPKNWEKIEYQNAVLTLEDIQATDWIGWNKPVKHTITEEALLKAFGKVYKSNIINDTSYFGILGVSKASSFNETLKDFFKELDLEVPKNVKF